jgi:outer membrane protein TolC
MGSYRLTAENVEQNRASEDDLAGAQMGLNAAELQLFSARAAYLNAVAAWLSAINADPADSASPPSPAP